MVISHDQEYQILWNQIVEQLSKELDENQFQQIFEDVKYVVKVENNIIYVRTPELYIKTKINNLYIRKISEIAGKLTTEKIKFKFVTDEELTKSVPINQGINNIKTNNLNQSYTFDSFVVGNSNKLAFMTAQKVAEQPGTLFNPLYIFGGVGLGKTHLMQAIGNSIADYNINNKVLYVQANDYMEDFARATRDNNMKVFEEKYDNLEVLLIDDIQMLEGKKGSQQEFFKLFQNMINEKKQIVITSDSPADKLNGFHDRLTSRFQSGITVDIRQPDMTQRVNILRRKLAETSQIKLEDEVLNYIAENFTDNVRELEGALTRVLWTSEVYGQKPNLAMAIEALEVLIGTKNKKRNNNYDNLFSVIADMYKISVADLLGTSRSSKYVLPRHIAMYILKTKYDLPFAKIGSILSGRDHTTVMNGYNKIDNEIKTNEQLKMAIDNIIKKAL